MHLIFSPEIIRRGHRLALLQHGRGGHHELGQRVSRGVAVAVTAAPARRRRDRHGRRVHLVPVLATLAAFVVLASSTASLVRLPGGRRPAGRLTGRRWSGRRRAARRRRRRRHSLSGPPNVFRWFSNVSFPLFFRFWRLLESARASVLARLASERRRKTANLNGEEDRIEKRRRREEKRSASCGDENRATSKIRLLREGELARSFVLPRASLPA